MQSPKLSKRLDAIASAIGECNVLADVGTDHALIPISLVLAKKAKRAILTDINEGPLEKASFNIALYGAKRDLFDLRRGDGLKPLAESEADTISICGMGGNLIAGILEKGGDVSKSAKLVLEPNTCWEDLREYLYKNGYKIEDEITLAEDNHPYLIIVAKYDGNVREAEDYYLGEFVSKMDEEYKKLLIKKSEAVLSHVESDFHRSVIEKLKYDKQENN